MTQNHQIFDALRRAVLDDTDFGMDHFVDDDVMYTYNDFLDDLDYIEDEEELQEIYDAWEAGDGRTVSEECYDLISTYCQGWDDFMYDFHAAITELRRDSEAPPLYETVLETPPPYKKVWLPPYTDLPPYIA